MAPSVPSLGSALSTPVNHAPVVPSDDPVGVGVGPTLPFADDSVPVELVPEGEPDDELLVVDDWVDVSSV